MVLPVLREQRSGPGKDVEYLVSRRTGALEVQPGNPENLFTMSDNQGVGYEIYHQEEIWHGLGASIQEGRHGRLTSGLARRVGYQLTSGHPPLSAVGRHTTKAISSYLLVDQSTRIAIRFTDGRFISIDLFLESSPPPPPRPAKIGQLIIALTRCIVNVMQYQTFVFSPCAVQYAVQSAQKYHVAHT